METSTMDHSLLEVARGLVEKFDRAWNERDPQALGELFHDGADFQFYHGVMVRGRERIQNFYRDKVFPYLEIGLTHITRKYQVREISDGVLIGDGRVDLVIMEGGDEKDLQKRLKVTTVVVQEGGGLEIFRSPGNGAGQGLKISAPGSLFLSSRMIVPKREFSSDFVVQLKKSIISPK